MPEHIPKDTEYVTIPELVERWQTTPSKLRRMVEEHQLAAVRVDGVLCIPAEFVTTNEPLHSLRGTLLAPWPLFFDLLSGLETRYLPFHLGDNDQLLWHLVASWERYDDIRCFDYH